jgi:hypothetical protein
VIGLKVIGVSSVAVTTSSTTSATALTPSVSVDDEVSAPSLAV